MDFERIRYRIYKLLPILIPVVLILIAVILIIVGQIKKNKDELTSTMSGYVTDVSNVDSTQTDTLLRPTLAVETVTGEASLNLEEHLETNCTLVEVTRIGNWISEEWYETYYDTLAATYIQYKVTTTNNEKQYHKILNTCTYSGEVNEITNISQTLPTNVTEFELYKINDSLYSINSLTDGYNYIKQLIQENKNILITKITAEYIDIYFKDGNYTKRALVTDSYILTDNYINEVPAY